MATTETPDPEMAAVLQEMAEHRAELVERLAAGEGVANQLAYLDIIAAWARGEELDEWQSWHPWFDNEETLWKRAAGDIFCTKHLDERFPEGDDLADRLDVVEWESTCGTEAVCADCAGVTATTGG